MKNYYLVTILILFSNSSLVFSQGSIHVQGLGGVSQFASSLNLEEERAYSIKGSPYYNKSFMFGKAEMYDGREFSGLFRYNAYYEEMEFIYVNDTLMIDNPISIKYIHFAAKKFTYSVIVGNYWRKNFIHGGYFEVLTEGPCQLLIDYDMDFRQNRYVAYYGGGGGDGNYRYVPDEIYYIRLQEDEPAFKLKLNKRFFYKQFPDLKEEISKYIKDKSINLKNRTDLISLVEHINTL
jgi:hypothetical protein